MNQNNMGEAEHESKDDKINFEKVIEEINNIRKEVKMLEDQASYNTFSKPNFNN